MPNSFGMLFQISTFGESHGPALGAVLDGCPSGLPLCVESIQRDLDRRRPGQSLLSTPRKEGDRLEILSGVFEGRTTGTPIALLIRNEDQRSADYSEMVNWYRPSHADLTYDQKYGFRDHRGGGRSSARETAARVAAGSIARQLLARATGTEILAWVSSVGDINSKVDMEKVNLEAIEANPIRCPDSRAAPLMEEAILQARKEQDSLGGIITLLVRRPPLSIGEPVFDRVEALLAHAMLSLPATKGFEIGSGFAGTCLRGSQHNDEIAVENGRFITRTNRAGGTLGGITNGQDIVCRIAFKPTATISQKQRTASRSGIEGELSAKGRHDPCVLPRAVVIVEAMAALVLADLYLQQRARAGLFALDC